MQGDLIQESVHASFRHLCLRCFDHSPFTASAPSCVAEAPQGKGGTRQQPGREQFIMGCAASDLHH